MDKKWHIRRAYRKFSKLNISAGAQLFFNHFFFFLIFHKKNSGSFEV